MIKTMSGSGSGITSNRRMRNHKEKQLYQPDTKYSKPDDQPGVESLQDTPMAQRLPRWKKVDLRFDLILTLKQYGLDAQMFPKEAWPEISENLKATMNQPQARQDYIELLKKRQRFGVEMISELPTIDKAEKMLELEVDKLGDLNLVARNRTDNRLVGVVKHVYRTEQQLKREEAKKYGILTKRGHGAPHELPILAYNDAKGRPQYLSKEQRILCLQNKLPNAPTCPAPPSLLELRAQQGGRGSSTTSSKK